MKYVFEQLEVCDNPSVIFRGIAGSHAYGTANAQSDTDTRGVFVVPSMEYVLLVPANVFLGERCWLDPNSERLDDGFRDWNVAVQKETLHFTTNQNVINRFTIR